jgi:hypothetical protein
MLNLAAFTAKQFNNHSFHQKIILVTVQGVLISHFFASLMAQTH